jgi:hypothetical protein
MVPPPVPDAQVDTVSILNPTSRRATVSIILNTSDGMRRPKELSQIRVGAGLRKQVPIAAVYGSKGPAVALVSYDVRGRMTEYRCDGEPLVQGENRVWSDCLVEVRGPEGTRQLSLFGAIMEREGVFKFVSYAKRIAGS